MVEENVSMPPGTAENENPANPQINSQGVPGPSREAPTPGPSTEERVSAHVEWTLQELGQQSEVRFLPPPESEREIRQLEKEVPKASVSDAITKVLTSTETAEDGDIDIDKHDDEMCETSRFKLKADFFQTDTTEVEDLYESAGADTATNRPTLIAPGVVYPDELIKELQAETNLMMLPAWWLGYVFQKGPNCSPGRALRKKYFSEAPPIRLPIGHRTLALSEPQVHTSLKVVSDEAVASSLRAVQTLVSETLKTGGTAGDSYPVALVLLVASLRVPGMTSVEVVTPQTTTPVGPSAPMMILLRDSLRYLKYFPPIIPLRLSRQDQKEFTGQDQSPGFTASDYRLLAQLCRPPPPESLGASRSIC